LGSLDPWVLFLFLLMDTAWLSPFAQNERSNAEPL